MGAESAIPDRPMKILSRVAAGDHQAVSECLDEYGGMVMALAERYLGARGHECEDAVQEIFVEVWKHAGRFSPQHGSEAAFIATIAHRRLIDRRRRATVRSSVNQSDLGVASTDDLATGTKAAQQIADHPEALEAFNQLTPDERQVVWLTVCQGYSHERASRALGTPLGTIKTRVRRGLVRMREFLLKRESQMARTDTTPAGKGKR